MNTKKYCYRYVDGNDCEGRAIVMIREMVIIRETEKTFWYCHDLPYMSIEQIRKYRGTSKDRNVKRCLKNAARSKFHMTREEALKAFVYRKLYQLERITLTAETVRLCINGLSAAGCIAKNSDGKITNSSNVLKAPTETFNAVQCAGPIASTYQWGEL